MSVGNLFMVLVNILTMEVRLSFFLFEAIENSVKKLRPSLFYFTSLMSGGNKRSFALKQTLKVPMNFCYRQA